MKNSYLKLINQTFEFPQEEFEVKNGDLHFQGIRAMDLIQKFGSPLKFTFLPKINAQIDRARGWFSKSMENHGYKGKYHYCYCTKSSHFKFVISQALKSNTHLETSSTFDIDIIRELYKIGHINKETYVICNGFKTIQYVGKIAGLINEGFVNVIPVLDNMEELDMFDVLVHKPFPLGIRIAAEEEPSFEFYTSRLGIQYKNILEFYETRIRQHPNATLKMLHFFINTGIRDTTYYWNELAKSLNVYTQLKSIAPALDSFNIGGGFPIKNTLAFEFDYAYMVDEIIRQIAAACKEANVPEPDIFTEFGKYTVGESGGLLFSVLRQKFQNDRELWYMVNGSFMTTLPDAWSIGERFILLPLNKWNSEYRQVNLGGLSCDQQDYYNSEVHLNQVFMPKLNGKEDLHIGFFHTGAYQDSLSGFGGIKHCLIPAPKHVLINREPDGKITTEVFSEEQDMEGMMKILGYGGGDR